MELIVENMFFFFRQILWTSYFELIIKQPCLGGTKLKIAYNGFQNNTNQKAKSKSVKTYCSKTPNSNYFTNS